MKKVATPDYTVADKLKTHVAALSTAAKEVVLPLNITTHYPRERKRQPACFRGFMLFDPERCISCFQCSFVCPANAIWMKEAPSGRYYPTVDHGKCIYCHFCVDTCPGGALKTTKIHDIAFRTMDEMVVMTEDMVEPPAIIREDKVVVDYVIDKEDLTLKRTKEVDELIVEIAPSEGVPMVSVCVDRGSCIACKVCDKVCESGAVSSVKDEEKLIVKMEIDPEKCTGCGLCVKECSMQILRLVRRE
ncbi:MAG: 4Fe-4S binding protein [Methanophagales archaeon]|nr:4Fe-4S binding protein [Methanophagales archaeon]